MIHVNALIGIPSSHYKNQTIIDTISTGLIGQTTVQYNGKSPVDICVDSVIPETQSYAGGIMTQLISLRNGYTEHESLKKEEILIAGIGSYTVDASIFRPEQGELVGVFDESEPRAGLWSIENAFRSALRAEYGDIFDDLNKWRLFEMFETGTYKQQHDILEIKRRIIADKIPQIEEFLTRSFGRGGRADRLTFFGRGLLDEDIRNALFSMYDGMTVNVPQDDNGFPIPDVAVAHGLHKGSIAVWLCQDTKYLTLNIGIDLGCKNLDIRASMNDGAAVDISFPTVTASRGQSMSSTGHVHRFSLDQPYQVDFGRTALLSDAWRHGMTTAMYFEPGSQTLSHHVKSLFFASVAEALRQLGVMG